MCPLKVIPKIFLFDEIELAPELRAQRTLNRARIPEMASYLADNPRAYIFSSITASIDGDTRFEPFNEAGPASNAGRLLIPMTARFLINDGQHRRAAIEEALRESPELGEESLSVVFFIDAGLKRSQQMFADLNRHAVRPTKSLGILYDHRDPLSLLARTLAETVSVFKNLTEMEKTSIPNRSNRLHTLSSIYQATRTLLGNSAWTSVPKRNSWKACCIRANGRHSCRVRPVRQRLAC
jgi:DNA sulfur modification protein DndB